MCNLHGDGTGEPDKVRLGRYAGIGGHEGGPLGGAHPGLLPSGQGALARSVCLEEFALFHRVLTCAPSVSRMSACEHVGAACQDSPVVAFALGRVLHCGKVCRVVGDVDEVWIEDFDICRMM